MDPETQIQDGTGTVGGPPDVVVSQTDEPQAPAAEPTGGATTPYEKDDRAARIKELAEKSIRRRQAEIEDKPFTEDTDTGEVEEVAAQPGPAEWPEKVKAMVDGKETEFDRDKVLEAGIRSLQKETSADEKLRKAEELLKEAEKVAVQRPAAPLAPTPAPAATPSPAPSAEITDQEFEGMAHQLQFGDPSEAAEALKKLRDVLKGSVQAGERPPSKEEVQSLVNEEVERRERKRNDDLIVDQFKKPVTEGGFSDLFEDPFLKAKTNQRVVEMLRDGAPDTWDTYRKAGEETREWIRKAAGVSGSAGGSAGSGSGNPGHGAGGPTLQEKDERKRTIISLRPAPGAQPLKPAAEPKPRTREEILRGIRQARGQEA